MQICIKNKVFLVKMAAQQSSTEESTLTTERHSYMAKRSVIAADVCLQKENFSRAFAHMLLAVKLTPEIKDDIKAKYAIAFQEWCKELEEQGRMEDVFNCYEQACDAFPECEPMLNSMGSQLFRLGYVDEAASCFRKALRIDPDFLGARENLENICSHLIERWHFRMLNDRKRNEAYQNAIDRAVKKGYLSVLDIGSGTGLLSMYAVQAGAEQIYACEVSKAMYELSCDIISANNMSDNISLIHKKSTHLVVGKDVPEKVKLIVTEIVDAGLLGENILPTLHHAWKELLLSPGWFSSWGGGRVIPSSAIVYVCAIESEDIRKQHRLVYPAMRHLDLSSATTTSNTFVMGDNYEPYTSEKLELLRNGYKRLSTVHAVCEIDFNSPQAIADYMAGRSFNLNMTVIAPGRLDAIAMWFDLELDDVTMISTAPEFDTCWQQAIYPVQQKHLRITDRRENFSVRTGDLLEVECLSSPYCLEFFCRNVIRLKTTPTTQLCTEKTKLIRSSTSDSSVSDTCSSINDVEIDIESPAICSTATNVSAIEFCRSIGDEMNADFTASIEEHTNGIANLSFDTELPVSVDSSRNLSSFGIINSLGTDSDSIVHVTDSAGVTLLRDKENGNTCVGTLDLFSCSQTNSFLPMNITDQQVYLLEPNEISCLNDIYFNTAYCVAIQKLIQSRQSVSDSGLLSMVDMSQGVSLLGLQAITMGVDNVLITDCSEESKAFLLSIAAANNISSNHLVFGNRNFDTCDRSWNILLTELVEPCGALRQQVLEDIALARITCLQGSGIVVPDVVTVHGMIISSPQLEEDSAVVENDRVLGLDIARFMNDFQMTTHVDIDVFTLPHTRLSQPFKLFDLTFNEPNTGCIPSFLEQRKTFDIEATECGHVTAVVYWFEMKLADKVKISTLDKNSHWKLAAVMQKTGLCVSSGQQVSVKAALKNSCIDIKVKSLR